MDACVLSAEEVGRLLHYGLYPCHADHYHLSPKQAIEALKREEMELVTTPEGRNYLTPVKQHYLKSIPSGASRIRVIQRTRMAPPKKVYPVR
jgi:hypothetical protein